MVTKVLVDTDIGSDVDDAVGLAYLLAQPECELLGITTVSGRGQERAMLASALCHAAGRRDVPIFVGAEEPLLVPQGQPDAPQAEALGSWPHETEFPVEPAVNFLRQTIWDNPGEVVLLTIGPLTNVAILFALDPDIPGALRGLVSMAGSFWSGVRDGREWNVLCDPHAAAMVYRARPPYHRSLGLDVTTQVTMDITEVRRRFQAELLRPVVDFAEIWFAEREVLTFHDPLAAVTIFEEQVCGFGDGVVTVDLHGDDRDQVPGETGWVAGGAEAPHQVGTTVDPAAFFEHYFAVLG